MKFRNLSGLLKLFKTEYRPYGWHIVLLGFLSFAGGMLEGVGITAVIPIFSFLNAGKGASSDFISQFIERFFNFLGLSYTLKFLLIFILALFLLKAVFLFLANQISAHIATSYEKKIRKELFMLTLRSNWSHLSEQKVGYLNQILNTDVSNSSALLTYISMLLITFTNLAIYTLLAFNISPIIALLAILFGFLVFIIFKPWFYKNKLLSQQVGRLYKDVAHFVDEVMIGCKAIKSMSLEQQVIKRGYKYFDEVRDWILHMALLKNSLNALLQPLGLILIVVIFAYYYKMSTLNFASFAVIVYAINKIFVNVQLSQVQLNTVSAFVPYLSVVSNYKKEASNFKEIDEGTNNFSFVNQIEFRDVGFSYNNTSETLSNVSFSIKKGGMVGVIGPSGAGKTTVVDLILRLFKPNKGEILIDGQSINDFKLSEWRANIGYVSQDSFLINDTIENNIKFYNDKVTHDDLVCAAKMANIDEFIENLPQKYDTFVGERGIRLSGGQRQRIILARVLVTKPQILILDEATSSLDNESELLIQKAINELKGSITVMAIAHRLSTVMEADNLVVIENGQMIEQGAPDELLKNHNSYLSRMCNLKIIM